MVTVEYVGTLIDGTEFENTVGRKEPTRFALMSVIPAWEEGLKLMPVGSKYRFVVPASLAYGTEAVGIIPPESALIFEIELKIKNALIFLSAVIVYPRAIEILLFI